MFSLTYISSATEPLSESQLMQLLVQSSAHNATLRITGMLLHKGGNFIQVLEGPQERVQDLYARIQRDGRHRDTAILLHEHVEKREFPQWSMGFQNLDLAADWNMTTCAEDLRTAIAANRSLSMPSRALALLADFIGLGSPAARRAV